MHWARHLRRLSLPTKSSFSTIAKRKDFRETPLGRQWFAVVEKYSGFLVLFQVGEFYEFYGDHARKASQILGITLTRRHSLYMNEIEMAGVPIFAASQHLTRLIRSGERLAICEQVSSGLGHVQGTASSTKTSKLLPRDVTRLVTPGTLLEEELLDPKSNNFVLAICGLGKVLGLAWMDISTGEFGCDHLDVQEDLQDSLARLSPAEILYPESWIDNGDMMQIIRSSGVPLSPVRGGDAILDLDKISTELVKLMASVMGDESSATAQVLGLSETERMSCLLLLRYVLWTQCGRELRVGGVSRFRASSTMSLDPSTRVSLELTRTLREGTRRGSLLWAIDGTVTSGGSRLLESHLRSPCTVVEDINARLDLVEWFHATTDTRRLARRILRGVHDVERALARIAVSRAIPADLVAIGESLTLARDIERLLREAAVDQPRVEAVDSVLTTLGAAKTELASTIASAFISDLPSSPGYVGFIRDGFSVELDRLRHRERGDKKKIQELITAYRTETGSATLKIHEVQPLGFCISVPLREKRKLEECKTIAFRPVSSGGLKSVCRFRTDQLLGIEAEHLESRRLSQELESRIFEDLCRTAVDNAEEIRRVAKALATLDVACALGSIAAERGYTRPVVLPGGGSPVLEIRQGRHPAVEHFSDVSEGHSFVPNDCFMSRNGETNVDERDGSLCWIITGPNMGGKSTFLRQNAVIAILAHMGSFVPADLCRMTVVDRLFSRIGASDDISRSRSTFMIEMEEAARFLKFASKQSLIIVDELGRGTSHREGLALCRAVLEHLDEFVGCRSLFATHFGSELTKPCLQLGSTSCHHTKAFVTESGRVSFSYKVEHGAGSDESMGIEVAALAGVPPIVIDRARHHLDMMKDARRDQTPEYTTSSPLELLLRRTNMENIRPDEAVRLLHALKRLSLC